MSKANADRAGREFEESVRRIARALWCSLGDRGGAEYVDKDNEIDIVCRTEEVTHLVECTTERTLEKVRKQVDKLTRASSYLQKHGCTVKTWIVTKEEGTPDQRKVARQAGVEIISMERFKLKLIDAASYLAFRWDYRFGSACDPSTGNTQLAENEYVTLPITNRANGISVSLKDLEALLATPNEVVLLGQFGAGKSLTIRELFRNLRTAYLKSNAERFPVAINLRDHWGQDDPTEVLYRHARRVGFSPSEHLVRAWHAGRIVLLLDGFDEIAVRSWSSTQWSGLRSLRNEAMALLRRFVLDSRGRTPILVAGRSEFFDDDQELIDSLGLQHDALRIHIDEFTQEQAEEYLKRKKLLGMLPSWLPKKPLLLGYLASRGLLEEALTIESSLGAAFAWDRMIDRVCQRESDIHASLSGDSVRQVLAILSTKAREVPAEEGYVSEADIGNAFRLVVGRDPDEAAGVLLQRLPGLTPKDSERGTRGFIDVHMLDCLRADFVARFVAQPFSELQRANWYHGITEFGYSALALKLEQSSIKQTQSLVAAREANKLGMGTLAIEILLAALRLVEELSMDCQGIRISNGIVDVLDFEEQSLRNLTLSEFIIGTLRLSSFAIEDVSIRDSIVSRLEGCADYRGLPPWLIDVEVESFESARTTTAIMSLSISLPRRVLLTIIRKLFVQKGSGRQTSALLRGLDSNARGLVEPVLRILEGEGIVFSTPSKNSKIWHGTGDARPRVMRIFSTFAREGDSLIDRVDRI